VVLVRAVTAAIRCNDRLRPESGAVTRAVVASGWPMLAAGFSILPIRLVQAIGLRKAARVSLALRLYTPLEGSAALKVRRRRWCRRRH